MVQHNDPQANKPAPIPEEHSGVFGFFRRYQKAILYSAGLFTLVTFSITSALYGLFDNLFKKDVPQPTIVVNGKSYEVDQEDRDIGRVLANGYMIGTSRQVHPLVLPNLLSDDTKSSELPDNLAILRRAAIAEGLDVSMEEVDKAIQAICDWISEGQPQKTTPTQLAVRAAGSVAQFRMLVKEAMRIGNYVRMQGLAVDTTDAAVMHSVLKDQEKLTLRVASFDAKALQEELKKGEVTEAELHTFLDGKDENWKLMHGVFDSNHVALQLGVCDVAAFDKSQWEEQLKDLDVTEDTLRRIYDQLKDPTFKVDKEAWQKAHPDAGVVPEYESFNDESVQARLQRQAGAGKVMDELLRKIRDQRNEALKAQNEALNAAVAARNAAQTALEQAKQKAAEKPEDAELKTAVETAEKTFEAKKAEFDAAEKALTEARVAFDFGKVFTELTKDKAGFSVKAVPEPQNAEQLATLPDDLGKWKNPTQATSLSQNGEIGSTVAQTDKVLFVFKATDLVVRPLLAWDKLKPKLEDEYWLEKAQEQTKAKKEAFEKALLDLAKARIPDEVAAIESKKQERVDRELASFDEKQNAIIAKANAILNGQLKGKEGSVAWQDWKSELDKATAELGKKEEHRKDIEATVQKQIDAEVAKLAKKHYGEVLDEAAQQAGFKVSKLPPYRRDLSTLPRFKLRVEPMVYFLFNGPVKDLKAGESTDLLEDATDRLWLLAVCDKVEPRTEADVTRREFYMARDNVPYGMFSFVDQRITQALQQSFMRDALVQRYQYKTPGEVENKPAN